MSAKNSSQTVEASNVSGTLRTCYTPKLHAQGAPPEVKAATTEVLKRAGVELEKETPFKVHKVSATASIAKVSPLQSVESRFMQCHSLYVGPVCVGFWRLLKQRLCVAVMPGCGQAVSNLKASGNNAELAPYQRGIHGHSRPTERWR